MPSFSGYPSLHHHALFQAQQKQGLKMLKSKTLWSGVTGIIGSLAGYMTGELEMGAAINIAITSLLAIFVRHGVKTEAEK